MEVFSAAQSIAFTVQTYNGVGRHLQSLTASQIIIYEKVQICLKNQKRRSNFEQAGYCSDILYIASMLVSKISILVLLNQITPMRMHKNFIFGVGGVILCWNLASLFAAAFQCRLPDPWRLFSPHCLDRVRPKSSRSMTRNLTRLADLSLEFFLEILWHYQYTYRIFFDGIASLHSLETANA